MFAPYLSIPYLFNYNKSFYAQKQLMHNYMSNANYFHKLFSYDCIGTTSMGPSNHNLLFLLCKEFM